MRPFCDSSSLADDAAALAERMREDGYLFLRGLLPRAAIAAVQGEVGAIARDAGWLNSDAPVAAAVADPRGFCVDPDPAI